MQKFTKSWLDAQLARKVVSVEVPALKMEFQVQEPSASSSLYLEQELPTYVFDEIRAGLSAKEKRLPKEKLDKLIDKRVDDNPKYSFEFTKWYAKILAATIIDEEGEHLDYEEALGLLMSGKDLKPLPATCVAAARGELTG